MSTTVVNIYRCTSYDIYIGRQNQRYGLLESKWANPYHIGQDGTRAQVVEKYRAYIQSSQSLLACLHELRGKTLACYCAPQMCHGNVLAELANA